jgi:hypothetical protein
MSTKPSLWGKGVWIIFAAFVVFMLGIVAFASFQRFDLVAPDYYAQQIDYQNQIDKETRTMALASQPTIEFRQRDRTLALAFGGFDNPGAITGSVRLFRPSNSSWDRTIELALDSLGMQSIPADKLPGGFWKVKLDWQANAQSYYLEQSIVVR